MLMLLNVDMQDGDLVSGTHIQWCCACDLLEAANRARQTEKANSNRITVAVVDELYNAYAVDRYYEGLRRLDNPKEIPEQNYKGRRSTMEIIKNDTVILEGDWVRYRTSDHCSQFGGKLPGKELIGKVTEIFDSMDKTYKCLWIEGQTELILEMQVIEKVPEEDIQLNRMCHSCRRRNVDCDGTTDPAWTGCVYRKSGNHVEIKVVRLQSVNYTPADLMMSWSCENGGRFYRTELGSARIRCHGQEWKYDHWQIQKNDDGTEEITLYLEIAEHGAYKKTSIQSEKETPL